ncbi:hypothetical protein QOZ80_9AG0683790 [Eleusine coracana subsp. coracana]|nr:hypothetical protein QOZ80_9AG0683790 [Eleusine coracana subsp. coracana]
MEKLQNLSYDDLKRITDNFSKGREIGEGGFGKVYKGVLNDKEIAVKMLRSQLMLDSDLSFEQEFYNIWKLRHENIVQLIGYCHQVQREPQEYNGKYVFAEVAHRALCFEYMHNGSLKKYLSDECDKLDWYTTYKIIKGTCEDKNMVAKIADFGLSKIIEQQNTMVTKTIIGSYGYMPPEYINHGKVSNKFDIYSLGVVIINMVTGPESHSQYECMSSKDFIELAEGKWKSKLQATCSDSLLLEEYCKQVKMCTEIALECVNPDRKQRPSILDIISKMLGTEVVINKLRPDVVQEETLCFDPTEIHFPLSNNCRVQERVRPLQLINKTENYVASKIIPANNTLVTQALVVVPPKSRFTVFLTPDLSRTTTDVMDSDNFYVYSTKITIGTNVTDELFSGVGTNSMEKAVIKFVYLQEEKPAFPFVQPGLNIEFPVMLHDKSLVTLELHSTEPWLLCLCSLNGGKTLQIFNYKTQDILFKEVVTFDTVKFWGTGVVASYGFGFTEVYNLTPYTPLTPFFYGTGGGTSLTAQRIYSFQAHSHAIKSLAIPPNGQYILTSDVQGEIKLWNNNCIPVRQFEGHADAVTEVKFSPDQNNIFASASRDCKVKIWNLFSTKPDAVLAGHSSEVTCVDFIPAKPWLISGSNDNTVKVWDYEAKLCLRKLEDTCNVRAISSHPKIPIIFSGLENGTIRLWNSSTNSIENSIASLMGGGVCAMDRKDIRVAIGCQDVIMILESYGEKE